MGFWGGVIKRRELRIKTVSMPSFGKNPDDFRELLLMKTLARKESMTLF
jgi:hypothetical protein